MESSDCLRMYLEDCVTKFDSRHQEILNDEGVRRELGNQPIDGKALLEALCFAAKKHGLDVFHTWAERQNFVDCFDDRISTEIARLCVVGKLIEWGAIAGPLG